MPQKDGLTAREALSWAARELEGAGIDDPKAEAEYLLTHILGCRRHELFISPERRLTTQESGFLRESIKRRKGREPSQYITGIAGFRGLEFRVTRDTLIPRPETELLVDEALKISKGLNPEGGLVAIDLCTGSGCIAVSLAKEMEGWRVCAADKSAPALAVARENAATNGVEGRIEFFEGDLFEPLEKAGLRGKASIVLSNPPYVPQAEYLALDPEVKDFEPKGALLGGLDGLDFIRRIIKEAPGFLKPGGFLLMEIGFGQARPVRELAKGDARYARVEIKKDLSGIERVLTARLKEKA